MANGRGGDLRDWDEEGYRIAIVQERDLYCRTVFRTVFGVSAIPGSDISPADVLVAASSDGSVAAYSISSCASAPPVQSRRFNHNLNRLSPDSISSAEPLFFIKGHKGPAYDLKFFGEGEDSLLLSCGDDGRILGWRWKDIVISRLPTSAAGTKTDFMLDLLNPQQKGPWDALSPIPETNAIDVNTRNGSVFSATGDACAYCWDVETGKRKMTFQGHSDYLHCVVAGRSSHRIITGSEDGTARIWDCKSGKCVQVLYPGNVCQLKGSPWVSCVAVDASESWMACGTGKSLSVWSLPSCECIWNINTSVPVQDVMFDGNQILAVGSEPVLTRFSINGGVLSQIQCAPQSIFSISRHPSGVTAVGGYGGVVDVISEYGSHLSTFRCQGM